MIRRLTSMLVLFSLLAGIIPTFASAAEFDDWIIRSPLPTSNSLSDVTYGNGTYVAVGTNGTIVTSIDGENWTTHTSGTERTLVDVAYGNGTFVTVGQAGTVLTSSDGELWINRDPGTMMDLYDITYVDGTFVAVGLGGTILFSSDGVNWTSRTSGTATSINAIDYGNGAYVAVGNAGLIVTSNDGVNWTSRTGATQELNGVAYGSGTFVVVGIDGQIATSNDGESWTSRTSGTADDLRGVTYDNDLFVAVGFNGTILTSTDGFNWTSRISEFEKIINGVTYGNGMYVAVGDYGTILASSDGASWTYHIKGTTNSLNGIIYGGGMYVAVGGVGTILTSTDGASWTRRTSGTANFLYDVTYGNGMYIAVGDNGTILTSGDGASWMSRTSGTSNVLNGVSYGNGMYVAVGQGGTILTSNDGVIWTSRVSGTALMLSGVAYVNDTYMALGQSGTILTSTDGASWTSRISGTTRNLYSVAYGNGMYVAVGIGGTMLSSSDAANWTSVALGTTRHLLGVFNSNGTYIAIGQGGTILTSGDGASWTNHTSGTTTTFYKAAYSNGSYVVVGDRGTILQYTPSAQLSSISVDQGTLSPAFTPTHLNYNVNVANSVTSLNVSITKADPDTTFTVTGAVYSSVTDSVYTYSASNLLVGSNPINIVVTAPDGMTTQTYTVMAVRSSPDVYIPPPPPPGSTSGGDQDSQTGFEVIVDGKPQDQIATAVSTKENGQIALTATIDAAKLEAQLAKAGDKPVIVIPASTADADKVSTLLTGAAVKAMENKQAVLEVQTPVGNYKLPAAQIVIDRVAQQLGSQVNLQDIVVHVDIARSRSEKVKLVENAAETGMFSIVAPPIDYMVTATSGGKTVEVDKFSSYVEREILLPDGMDLSRITTAIVVDADGETHHVPTYVTIRDGKYYAVVSSLTNSTYALIWHPMTFADMDGHWAKDAVNEMASRMVVTGVDHTRYNPNAAITRSEFAAIVVRALGLSDSGATNAFRDVKPGAWYTGAVAQAYEYGIVQGYKDGTFRPDQTITREEAIVMIARVMQWTGLSANVDDMDASTALSAFADGSKVSGWSKQAMLEALSLDLIRGSGAGLLPESPITRAETATIVERLMVKSKLID